MVSHRGVETLSSSDVRIGHRALVEGLRIRQQTLMLLCPELSERREIGRRPRVRIRIVVIVADTELAQAPIHQRDVQQRLERRSVVGAAFATELLVRQLRALVEDQLVHADVIANQHRKSVGDHASIVVGACNRYPKSTERTMTNRAERSRFAVSGKNEASITTRVPSTLMTKS